MKKVSFILALITTFALNALAQDPQLSGTNYTPQPAELNKSVTLEFTFKNNDAFDIGYDPNDPMKINVTVNKFDPSYINPTTLDVTGPGAAFFKITYNSATKTIVFTQNVAISGKASPTTTVGGPVYIKGIANALASAADVTNKNGVGYNANIVPGAGGDVDLSDASNNASIYGLVVNALPVTFGEITANIKDNMLFVNWSTEMEKNNKQFIIEASKDGATFIGIDSIATKAVDGNSDRKIEYYFSKSISSAVAKLGMGLGLGIYGMFAYLVAALALFILAFSNVNRPNRRKIGSYIIGVCLISSLAISGCRKDKEEVPVDNAIPAKVFVRITQVDIDGTRVSSKMVQAVKE